MSAPDFFARFTLEFADQAGSSSRMASTAEGDYFEIGNMGAYGRAIAGHFNGYGDYDEAILLDEPMMSMYATNVVQVRSAQR